MYYITLDFVHCVNLTYIVFRNILLIKSCLSYRVLYLRKTRLNSNGLTAMRVISKAQTTLVFVWVPITYRNNTPNYKN